MKPHRIAITGLTSRALAKKSESLKPRSTYPELSILTARRGHLQKLAWIFGFRL